MGPRLTTVVPWDRPDPFVIEITVQAKHIDALGHVNNVHYLGWLQHCVWAHSSARGIDEKRMVALDRAMVVRETHMQYLSATFAGERLLVANWLVTNDGRLRATRKFQIICADDSRTVMRASIDYVCMRISSGKPTRMPAEFIRAYTTDNNAE